MNAPKTHRRGFTLIELLVVVAVVCVLMTLIVPAVHRAQTSARNARCRNNLKQISLSLHNYHDTHFTLPPGWVSRSMAADTGPRYGWMFMITPFMDRKNLYEQGRFTRPLPLPGTNPVVTTTVESYRCPADLTPATNPLRSGYAASNYSGNGGGVDPTQWVPERRGKWWPGRADTVMYSAYRQRTRYRGIFAVNSNARMRLMTSGDGTTNTVMVGERCITTGAGIWPGVADNAFPTDQLTYFTPNNVVNAGRYAFSSLHPGGANFAMGDASVRFVSDKIDPKIYQALGTAFGGETIPREF